MCNHWNISMSFSAILLLALIAFLLSVTSKKPQFALHNFRSNSVTCCIYWNLNKFNYTAYKSDCLMEFVFICSWLLWHRYEGRSIEAFRYFPAAIYFIYYFGNLIHSEIITSLWQSHLILLLFLFILASTDLISDFNVFSAVFASLLSWKSSSMYSFTF